MDGYGSITQRSGRNALVGLQHNGGTIGVVEGTDSVAVFDAFEERVGNAHVRPRALRLGRTVRVVWAVCDQVA